MIEMLQTRPDGFQAGRYLEEDGSQMIGRSRFASHKFPACKAWLCHWGDFIGARF